VCVCVCVSVNAGDAGDVLVASRDAGAMSEKAVTHIDSHVCVYVYVYECWCVCLFVCVCVCVSTQAMRGMCSSRQGRRGHE